jgi:putative ABC transport system permease protein
MAVATRGWVLPFQLAVQELASHKMRSAISSFAVFLGVAAYLVMTSFSAGMQEQNTKTFLKMGGAQVLTIETMQARNPGEQVLFAKSPGLHLADFTALRQRVPEVEQVLPQISSNLQFRIGGRRLRGMVLAQAWDNFAEYNYSFDSTGEVNRANWDRGAAIALVGSRVADDLRKATGKVIGQEMSLQNGGRVKVAGVIQTDSKFDRRSSEIDVTIPWILRELGTDNPVIPSSALKIRDLDSVPSSVVALKAELLSLHRGVPDADVTTNDDAMQDSKQAIFVMALVIGIISAIALVSGGVGILNILFASLASRIRDLGIHKAMGATPRTLFRQVFMEAFLVSGLGGLMGCITGILPSLIAKNALPFQPVLGVFDLLCGLALALGIGVGAGILPALKASKLDPVEAMRA